MEITCINCGQTCEVDEEPEPGQHLLCPFCDVKFSYTPQDTTGDNVRHFNRRQAARRRASAKITTSCPHCGAKYEVEPDYIGVTAICGTCTQEFVITEPQTADEHDVCSSDRPVEAIKEDVLENASNEENESVTAVLRKKRFKAFSEKTKTAAISAKDKTISLWKSGLKGRAVIAGLAIILALCFFAPFIFYRNAEANYEMGLRYLKGDGVEKDIVKATELFRQAAGQGNADAQYQLGAIYGGLLDWNESAKWYQAAAEQGHTEAKLGLGFCYFFGLGVSKDESKGTLLVNEAKKDPKLQDQIQDFLNHFRFADNKQPSNNSNDAEIRAQLRREQEEEERRLAERRAQLLREQAEAQILTQLLMNGNSSGQRTGSDWDRCLRAVMSVGGGEGARQVQVYEDEMIRQRARQGMPLW